MKERKQGRERGREKERERKEGNKEKREGEREETAKEGKKGKELRVDGIQPLKIQYLGKNAYQNKVKHQEPKLHTHTQWLGLNSDEAMDDFVIFIYVFCILLTNKQSLVKKNKKQK